MAGDFLGSLGTISVKIAADVADYLSDMSAVAETSKQTADDVREHFAGLREVSESLTAVGAGLTAAVTVPLGALAAASLDAAGDMQALQAGLTAVAGSSSEAEAQMKRLKEVAKLPGLGLEEAVQGSIRLQAVGVSAAQAEKDLSVFGNALATVGKGRADLEGVIAQLVQMSSKTKVVADDLRPIMERVPQVATILNEAFGTIDTEQLQKANLTTKEVIGTIVDGLGKLPPVSGGINNAFENLNDTMTQTLTAIGNVLIPVVATITPMLESMLTAVKDLADFFVGLPAPVQAFIGTLVLLAAALGPILATLGGIGLAITTLMPLLTAITTFFGTSLLAISGWGLAIGAVLAALVALAVWINDNWEPIVAVVTQAWDGISELWGAAWATISGTVTGVWDALVGSANGVFGPLVTMLTTVWNAVAPYFTAVWNGIAGFLGSVWDSIRTTAASVWGGIVGAFQTFIEWAEKIPGAAKLINLDDAWKSAQKLKEQASAAAASVKTLGTNAGTAATNVPKFTAAVSKSDEASKKASKSVGDMNKKVADLVLTAKQAAAISDWHDRIDKLRTATVAYLEPSDKLNANIAELLASSDRLAKQNLPPVIAQMTAMKQPADDLNAALKELGITSTTELTRVANEAKAAYDVVMGSNIATDAEKRTALVKMLEAQETAAIKAGETVPQAVSDQLDAIKRKQDEKLPGITSAWSTFGETVGGIVNGAFTDMGRMLFEGDMSFGERGKQMLKDIGQAALDLFIKPFETAASNLMTGVINDLLSGKGFGGILGSIKDIGSSIGGIFGAGGSAASSAAGGAATAGSGAAQAGGAIASGLMGVLSAVGSIGSMISGIIGNFQNAKMETTMNAIEDAVRYLKIGLVTQADSLLNDSHKIRNFLDNAEQNYWSTSVGFFQDVMGKLEGLDRIEQSAYRMIDRVIQLHDRLAEISSNTYATQLATEGLYSLIEMQQQRPTEVTIYVSGASDPASTASAVQLKLQGVFL